MSKDDKWTKSDQPPPPMFLGEKERNLVKQVNDEIIERIVGQQVLYFGIDAEKAFQGAKTKVTKVSSSLPEFFWYLDVTRALSLLHS